MRAAIGDDAGGDGEVDEDEGDAVDRRPGAVAAPDHARRWRSAPGRRSRPRLIMSVETCDLGRRPVEPGGEDVGRRARASVDPRASCRRAARSARSASSCSMRAVVLVLEADEEADRRRAAVMPIMNTRRRAEPAVEAEADAEEQHHASGRCPCPAERVVGGRAGARWSSGRASSALMIVHASRAALVNAGTSYRSCVRRRNSLARSSRVDVRRRCASA